MMLGFSWDGGGDIECYMGRTVPSFRLVLAEEKAEVDSNRASSMLVIGKITKDLLH